MPLELVLQIANLLVCDLTPELSVQLEDLCSYHSTFFCGFSAC